MRGLGCIGFRDRFEIWCAEDYLSHGSGGSNSTIVADTGAFLVRFVLEEWQTTCFIATLGGGGEGVEGMFLRNGG